MQGSPWLGDLRQETMSQLFSVMRDRLPHYMVPSALVLMDEIPLTPNGKVDRKALPAPERSRGSEQSYVAPRNESERQLSQIWAEVLGLARVGIEDNFFDLGGDSILAIQMTSRANRVGISVTAQDVFRAQTVSRLLEVCDRTVVRVAEQGRVSGKLGLTPIQHWYFGHQHPEPGHWNMAMGLEIRGSAVVDVRTLERALIGLLEHHDGLRSRFVQAPQGWQAQISAEIGSAPLRHVDLSGRDAAEQEAEYAREVAQAQQRLNLAVGPLLRVVHVEFGPSRPGRLVIVAHHLVIDGVSWRIVLEDLASAYAQVAQGEAVRLGAKTSSLQAWSEALQRHADTQGQEVPFWLRQMPQEMPQLPVDFANEYPNTMATAEEISIRLSPEETEQLLQQVPSAYNTQINDVLLTALVRALHGWLGSEGVSIALEGHGREQIEQALDTTRTVGWFTTIFPVFLSVPVQAEVGTALKLIKEQLRQIPGRGIGYGLLRYLSEDPDIHRQLASRPQPQISFNYLGRFDRLLPPDCLFVQAQIPLGASHSQLARRAHLLDINGMIQEDCLQLHWTYSGSVHRRATIQVLATRYLEQLRALIAHCTAPEAGGVTPSDFPYADLSQTDLDVLFNKP